MDGDEACECVDKGGGSCLLVTLNIKAKERIFFECKFDYFCYVYNTVRKGFLSNVQLGNTGCAAACLAESKPFKIQIKQWGFSLLRDVKLHKIQNKTQNKCRDICSFCLPQIKFNVCFS